MSTLLTKKQCPNCSKKGKDNHGDNLAVYADGHSYCYSCGYYLPAYAFSPRSIEKQPTFLNLPTDVMIDYPSRVIEYIAQYEITKEDLIKFNFLWSEKLDRLIFPIWENDQLIFYTGRSFDTQKSKWIIRGKVNPYVINRNAKRFYFVEDIFSGIKISNTDKDLGAVVLFNSHSPKDFIIYNKKLFNNKKLFLYLDRDKFTDSIQFCKVIRSVNVWVDIKPMASKRDPKDESYETLRDILCGV